MVKTAEQKVRARYAEQLKQGSEPRPLNDANRAILAEVRAEVHRAKRKIQEEVEQGSNAIKKATAESVREIAEAREQALRALSERSSGSNSSQTVVEAPIDPLAEEPGPAPIQINANIVAVGMAERRQERQQERKRRRVVNDQARDEIMPAARNCEECADADFIFGGLCSGHDQELQQITARLNKGNVELDGVATDSSDSE